MKSLKKTLNTQSFKCIQEKKNSLTVYITTIAYIVMLPVTPQGLQIYIRALSSCGVLFCENISSWLARIFSNKNSLGFNHWYTKRETLGLSVNKRKSKHRLMCNRVVLICLPWKYFPLSHFAHIVFCLAWIGPKSTCLYKTTLVSDDIIHVQHFIYKESIRCSKVQTHEHPTVSIIQVLWYNTMFLNNIH